VARTKGKDREDIYRRTRGKNNYASGAVETHTGVAGFKLYFKSRSRYLATGL